MRAKSPRSRTRRAAGGGALLSLSLLCGSAAQAETGWVRGEVHLNVRTGPGTGYRIIGGVQTGDSVEILQNREEWTWVQTADEKRGWVRAGYLEPQPPRTVRLDRLEVETRQLRERLATAEQEATRLRKDNEGLQSRNAARRTELEQLQAETFQLEAGERWPYLITGASILAGGMMIGSILARASARRTTRRIKL